MLPSDSASEHLENGRTDGAASAKCSAVPEKSPSGILGTGSSLPEKVLSNNELSKFIDTSDEWIRERVGVGSRHVAGPTESTVSLSCQACERALEAAQVDIKEIDLIIVGTVTPDQALPSAAALIQQRLRARKVMAFDVAAACSGFLYGLSVADSMQKTHGFGKALVLGAETLSRIVDWSDRRTCVLFGDGAGAVVYEGSKSLNGSSEASGVIAVELHCNGTQSDLICRPAKAFPPATLPESVCPHDKDPESPYVHMKGREVFKTGVISMYSSMKAVLAKADCTIDDVSFLIPHQSNERMIEAVCDKIKLGSRDKLIYNLDRVGNTSAASIPIALDETARAGRIKKGDLILMTAVGAGITYGSVLLKY